VVAFLGLGVEHDRQVNRPGAYAETCLAIQRVHAAGLRAGCNVFLTTANAGQAERLLGALGRLQVDQMAWEPATYYPMPRGRRNERLRPRPSELLPLADRIRQLSPFHRDAWANLEAHTDGWTGPSDAPPPSSTRGPGMSERLAWCPAISVDACPSITPRRHHGPPGDPGGQHACGEPCHRWVVSSTGWDSVP